MACTYVVKNSAGEEISFDTKEGAIKYARDNNLADTPSEGAPESTTATLANVLRQMAFGENNYNPQELRVYQESLLDEFIRLEGQSGFFYKIGSGVALTKGLGKSFDQVNNIKRNLFELGIDNPKPFEELGVPFDARYLLTGDPKYKVENSDPYYHKITAGNINKMNEVVALSKTIFMEQTPEFKSTYSKVIANLKNTLSTEKLREIADDLTAYYQIAAYKQWIIASDQKTSTLRNSLIYDSSTPNRATETIVDIVKEAIAIDPTNTFLKFILPVNTVVKIGKKQARNVNNKDLINTIEGKTRGKIEPDLVSNMMDSFTELYQNPKTRYHAKALFDYLIVKDGLMFKNKSFIKMIPTMMWDNMSIAADISTELLSISTIKEYGRLLKKLAATQLVDSEGNYKDYFTAAEQQEYNDLFRKGATSEIKDKIYKKVFGKTADQLYSRFEGIYATDQKYQYNLDFIKPKGKKAISIDRATSNVTVKMFTDDFYKAEKGSEERSKIFKDNMKSIGEANFGGIEIDENNTNIIFKKFIRVSEASTSMGDYFEGMPDEKTTPKYMTYQLIETTRETADGKFAKFTGTDMTVEGELVPRGVGAVYAPIDVVGTSNSTGVVDLGARPTKDKVLETINDRIIREEQPAPPASIAANTSPVIAISNTPTPVNGGTYSGFIKTLGPNQVFVFGSNPMGINGNPEKGTGGAALAALQNGWVAQGEKMDNKLSKSGKAWGLTTVVGPGLKRSKNPDDIKFGIKKLYEHAQKNPGTQFLVAYTGRSGTNLNGYSNKEMADMFSSLPIPNNIIFEVDFNTLINRGNGSTKASPTPAPVEPPVIGIVQGGMFGGLAMVDEFDPNDLVADDFYVSESEINDSLNKKDKC